MPSLRDVVEMGDEPRMIQETTAVADEFDALYAIYRSLVPEQQAITMDLAVGNMLAGSANHGM